MNRVEDDIWNKQLYVDINDDIDGASAARQMWSITLPMLWPTHTLIIMLQIIASFKIFAQMKFITDNNNKFWSLIAYIYESSFNKNNLGYGAAMSYALFLILIVLTLIQFFWTNRREARA